MAPGTPTAISTASGGDYINRTDDVSSEKAQITVAYPSDDVSSVRIRINSETSYYENTSDLDGSSVIEIPVADLVSSSTLHAWTVDDAGNTSAEFDRAYTVDTTIPSTPTSITSSTGATYINKDDYDSATPVTITVGYGASNSGDTIYIDYNSNTASGAYESDKTTAFEIPDANLVTGSNTFTAYAKDTAGNESGTTSLTLIMDIDAPTINSLTPAGGTADTDYTLTASVSESCTYDWAVSASDASSPSFTNGLSVLTLENFTSGVTYTITLTATDTAGNVTVSSAQTFTPTATRSLSLLNTKTNSTASGSGSSGSSSSGSGRISVYNFDKSSAEKSVNTSDTDKTVSYVSSGRNKTSDYNGTLNASTPAPKTVENTAATEESADVSVSETENAPKEDTAVDVIIPTADTSGSSITIQPAALKASSAALASGTTSSVNNSVTESGNSKWLWLLVFAPAAGALIILKKRRQ